MYSSTNCGKTSLNSKMLTTTSEKWLIFVLIPHSSRSFLSLASLNSGCILSQSPRGQLIQVPNIKQTCATSGNEKAERQKQRKKEREKVTGMRDSLSSADWWVYKTVHRLCRQCRCELTVTATFLIQHAGSQSQKGSSSLVPGVFGACPTGNYDILKMNLFTAS